MGPSESDVILEIVHLNINVRDIERSLAFYTKLGFEVMHTFGTRSENGTWEPMRFRGRAYRGVVLSLGDHPRSATKIEVIEWIDPPTTVSAPRGETESGVARIALRTRNLLDFVQQMREQGIAFESDPIEIDVVGAKRFVLFRDPDRNLLELIEF